METHSEPGRNQLKENTDGQIETCLVQKENLVEQQPTAQSGNEYRLHRAAIRMAGFLFWSNVAALFSLSVGCVSPGWLTINNNDYSLWYFTRCDMVWSGREVFRLDKLRHCETQSYRLIQAMPIGTEFHKDLKYTDFTRAEVLYCLGMLLSFVSLCELYKFRGKVAAKKCVDLSIKKWLLLLLLAVISAIVVFVPVDMFSRKGSTFSSFLSGIALAGFGGAMMSLIAASILLHLSCYRVRNCDICLCTTMNEPLVQASKNV